MDDYGTQIAQLIAAGYSQQQAQALLQSAYDKAQANLADVKGQYKGLATPQYKTIAPEVLGDTELKGIQNDPQGRLAEQQAYAELKKLSDSGGLSLGDQAALNEIQGNLNRNAMGRDKALQNSYAARGQLGGGAQLAMELSQGQNANERANQQGESVAAQAQARALSAIKERANLGRQMSQDDYEKKAAAAKAADLIKERNAANSMQAQQENNGWLGQGFQNDMSKINGQAGLTKDQNAITEKSGQAAANNALGTGNLIQSGIGAGSKLFGGGPGSTDQPGGGAPAYQDPNVLNTAPQGDGSSPSEWAQFGQSPSTGASLNDYDPSKLTEED